MPNENTPTITTPTNTEAQSTSSSTTPAAPAASSTVVATPAATPDPEIVRLQEVAKLAKGGKRIDAIKALLQAEDLDDVVAEYVRDGEDPVKKKLREIDEAEARRVEADKKRKEDEEAAGKTKAQRDSDRYVGSILDKHKDKFKSAAKPENRAEVTAAASLIAIGIFKRDKIDAATATAEQGEKALCEAFDRIQKDWRKKYLEEVEEAPATGSVGRPPQKASVKIASPGDLSTIEAVLERNRKQAKYAGKSS